MFRFELERGNQMLDKTLPYYNIIMKRRAGTPVPVSNLNDGYHFKNYTEGDAKDWCEIMVSVGEFDHLEEAQDYFDSEYGFYLKEIKRRMLFIENNVGEKVGTLTMWWRYTGERRNPTLEWIGVKPNVQGQGLGRALIFEGMKRMIAIEEDRDFFLHTQTWSHKAINIYLLAGYNFVKNETFCDYTNDYENALITIRDKIRKEV